MTLQQKLLAKQSKKGFTLVELVVVIAILAILAAIAIPAVIGIINSANESQAKSDAASVDAACKDYYAEVVAGTINASNAGKVVTDTLPGANAAPSLKKSTALSCTVQGGLEYAGLTNLAGKVGDFRADTNDGTIYADVDKGKPTTATHTVATTDTFTDLGYS